MKIHKMRLDSQPFDLLVNGKKDVELRLYDSKRRRLSVGDRIIFSHMDNEEKQFAVEIKALYIYASFEDLFSEIPLIRCGFENNATIQEAVSVMRTYYKREIEIDKGVIGISMKPVDTNIEKMRAYIINYCCNDLRCKECVVHNLPQHKYAHCFGTSTSDEEIINNYKAIKESELER